MAEIGTDIKKARLLLEEGGLVAIPTETVYGLAGNAYSADIVINIFKVKNRPSFDPLITHTDGLEKIKKYVQNIPELACQLANAFWPGPLTMILPRHPSLPDVLAPLPTIGVRIPDHPVALALLKAAGPLAVTSANISGADNTMTARQVMKQLKGRIHLIIDGGRTPGGVPSTVIDCTTLEPKILREGPISLKQIKAICT